MLNLREIVILLLQKEEGLSPAITSLSYLVNELLNIFKS